MNETENVSKLTIVDIKNENNVTGIFDDYYNIFMMCRVPVNVRELCQLMITWVNRKEDKELGIEEPLRFDEFLNENGIHRVDYYKLKDRHECLQHTHEYVMSRLASIRERGAAKKVYNDATVARTAGWYQPEVRAEQERLAALQKNSIPDQRLILMIPAAPNSNEVEFRAIKNETVDIKVKEENKD
jgi:hypothetical protein